MGALELKPTAHVVDVLGNVIGRDQPILRMEKALEMVSLLGEEVFADENVVFFDPFCKAGELLLACAFLSCKAKSKKAVLDLDVITKEIYESNRYFGMAPDERHHRLSLRTFLGNEVSHNEKYNHIIRDGHYVSEEDGRLDQDKFEKEFKSMIDYIKSKSGNKKIIAVGNPPYQEADGGASASAKPVYNIFTESLCNSKDIAEFILVIPARWFGGGKGLDGFRDTLINSRNIKSLRYFQRAEEIFPTVHIQGGVCFLNYAKDHLGETLFQTNNFKESIKLDSFDIIPDDPYAFGLIKKVTTKSKKFVSEIAWSRKPFGLETNYFKLNAPAKSSDKNIVKCLIKNKQTTYIKESNIPKNKDKIDFWKVAIPCAYGLTGRCTLPPHQIFLVEPGTIMTETYSVIEAYKSKEEAESLLSYLQTDFARYMLGLRKITQHIPRDRWNWVPLIELNTKWTNEKVYKLFGVTDTEKKHIEKMLKEWS